MENLVAQNWRAHRNIIKLCIIVSQNHTTTACTSWPAKQRGERLNGSWAHEVHSHFQVRVEVGTGWFKTGSRDSLIQVSNWRGPWDSQCWNLRIREGFYCPEKAVVTLLTLNKERMQQATAIPVLSTSYGKNWTHDSSPAVKMEEAVL